MKNSELNKKWDEQKMKLIQEFSVLTNNKLIFIEGKKEEMLKDLQIKLG